MEIYERIRIEHRDGASIRSLAERFGVHRRTVRQAIASATPPARKAADRGVAGVGFVQAGGPRVARG